MNEDELKNILVKPSLSRMDKILLILSTTPEIPIEIKNIKKLGINCGLREIQSWNIGQILSRSKGKAIRTPSGWELTTIGKSYIESLIGTKKPATSSSISHNLRSHLPNIKNKDTSDFVEEAICCFDNRLFRSAVVLSWVGAMAILYDYIISNKLNDFNSEASKRNPKWKNAKTPDDLARMKEKDFLDILEAISIIGHSVKRELETCLNLRNGCGHPNSLKIAEHRVSGHIEILILNVFSKFT